MPDTPDMTIVLTFLRQLDKHNERPWFEAHRKDYDSAHDEFELLVNILIGQLSSIEDLAGLTAKDCMMRIYRDVRFSKDKSPYRTSFAASLAPGGRKSWRMGWYVHVEPGDQSMVAGGMYQPEPPMLAHFRQSIDEDPRAFRKIINAASFKKYFGEIEGESLKSAPQGYPKDHPDINLLRMKSVTAVHHLSDAEVLAEDFSTHVVKACKAMKPFLDYFNALHD